MNPSLGCRRARIDRVTLSLLCLPHDSTVAGMLVLLTQYNHLQIFWGGTFNPCYLCTLAALESTYSPEWSLAIYVLAKFWLASPRTVPPHPVPFWGRHKNTPETQSILSAAAVMLGLREALVFLPPAARHKQSFILVRAHKSISKTRLWCPTWLRIFIICCLPLQGHV